MTALKLGDRAKCVITGFEGILISRVEYLTGCTQWGVNPGVDKDGKLQEAVYSDESRLETVAVDPISWPSHAPQTAKGGPNRDCPKR